MRLIDADALLERESATHLYNCLRNGKTLMSSCRNYLHLAVGASPTIDAVPVVHGRWINEPPYRSAGGDYLKAQECSVCQAFYVSDGNKPYSNYNYCAVCGARMDGDPT